MGLRERLEREAEGETVTLVCRGCGEEMTVAEDTDLALLAYEWVQGSGGESYQPTPPDVFVVTHTRADGRALCVAKMSD